jgi:hypothetical protein
MPSTANSIRTAPVGRDAAAVHRVGFFCTNNPRRESGYLMTLWLYAAGLAFRSQIVTRIGSSARKLAAKQIRNPPITNRPKTSHDRNLIANLPTEPSTLIGRAGQTVDATLSIALTRRCFRGGIHLLAGLAQNLARGSALAVLTSASDLAFVFNANWVRPECCVDLLNAPDKSGLEARPSLFLCRIRDVFANNSGKTVHNTKGSLPTNSNLWPPIPGIGPVTLA